MPIAPAFPFRLREEKADIIHFHHPFPLGELSVRAIRFQPRLVVTWHSDVVRQIWFRRFYNLLYGNYLKQVDRILVTSPNYLEYSKILQTVRHKCRIVPLGIDTRLFAITPQIQAQAEEIRSRHGEPLLLFVGRLVPYKGLPVLLEAVFQIPEVRLIIVGDGPKKAHLEAIIQHCELQDRVTIRSGITDENLAAYYHACDIFVLPSSQVNETFGLVQVEAMASRKPVISTNLPTGVPFVNEHGKSGLVVRPSDSDALRNAIRQLLESAPMRREFGEYGYHRAHSLFDIAISARQITDCYRELLAANQ
jgi:rhamnosyl/mannosyltransferase